MKMGRNPFSADEGCDRWPHYRFFSAELVAYNDQGFHLGEGHAMDGEVSLYNGSFWLLQWK